MTTKEKNYWLETITTPPAQSAAELPDSVDVAVVGAGFTGLSAARVGKRGVKVAVLEAETLGWGASCRNGGMALTGLKLHPQSRVAVPPEPCTRAMVRME